MEIEYRLANSDDLNEIDQLIKSAIAGMKKQNIFQWDDRYPTMDDFQEDIEKNQLHVGVMDGSIAVLYALNQECDAEYAGGKWKYADEPFYVVHRLCVNPAFQNRGIAKKALLHMEKELRAVGIHSIRLDVFSQNPHALKLYDSLGYARTGYADWRMGRFYLMEKYF